MIERILPSFNGLRHARLLEEEFRKAPDEWLRAFVSEVDQSPYSLFDWMKAHDYFMEWTFAKKRPLALKKRQEYLNCCIEGMKDPAGTLSLSSILEYFLNQNGVD